MEKVFRENYDNNDNDNADSHDGLNDNGRNRLLRQRKRWSYDEGNTEMDGKNDDAYTYDDDDDDYDDDDESYCFRYQIMRNCWQEEPDDRPSFEQLRRELKLMENQHKVVYRNLILSLRYLSYNVHMKWILYILSYAFQRLSNLLRFVIFPSQRLINMKDYDTKLYENVEDLMS